MAPPARERRPRASSPGRGRHRCPERSERRVPRSRPDDAERRGTGRKASHSETRDPSLPPAFGGLCRPEVGVPLPARRSARWGRCRDLHHRGTGKYALSPRCAGRCRSEDRRSLAALPGGVSAETCAIPELGSTPSRPAARGGAGRRPAFPGRSTRWGRCRDVRHPGTGKYALSPRCAGRCRPEAGVPWPLYPVG